jgi:hypothetical protein
MIASAEYRLAEARQKLAEAVRAQQQSAPAAVITDDASNKGLATVAKLATIYAIAGLFLATAYSAGQQAQIDRQPAFGTSARAQWPTTSTPVHHVSNPRWGAEDFDGWVTDCFASCQPASTAYRSSRKR